MADKTIKITTTLLLGIASLVFWMAIHPEWLSFHEQYQMFLFRGDYLYEHLAFAGGLADYLAEFSVQFFLFPWCGALVMALYIVSTQLVSWQLASKMGASPIHYPLSAIPSIAIVAYSGDQYVMPTFFMTLLLASLAAWGYTFLDNRKKILQLLIIPIVYWATGYGLFVYISTTCLYDIITANDKQKGAIAAFISLSMAAIIILVSSRTFMLRYTWHDIIMGVNNYRVRLTTPNMQHIVALLVALTPFAIHFASKLKRYWATAAEYAVIIVAAAWCTTQFKPEVYQMLKLDYFVRNERWNAVINYSKQGIEYNNMSCSAINLALGMRGELMDKLLDFPQTNQEGLLTRFNRNMISCTITAEACYHLGLINSALRYNYDLQESIDNRNKSCRFTKRIAEGYIINGRYNAAKKYLDRLSHTLFYSDWAKDAMTYLRDENRINSHPVWGKLRRYQFDKDELYSVNDLCSLLCHLFEHCNENNMALDYGLACAIVNDDLVQFNKYYPLSEKRTTPYKTHIKNNKLTNN